MQKKVDTEPRIVYASLLSELRGDFVSLRKESAILKKSLATQCEELLKLRHGFQDLKVKIEAINVMVKVAGLSEIEIELPSNLRLTYNTLCVLVVADAQQVADVTRRARAVESAYLNQLVRMNIISAERAGRKKKFSLTSGK